MFNLYDYLQKRVFDLEKRVFDLEKRIGRGSSVLYKPVPDTNRIDGIRPELPTVYELFEALLNTLNLTVEYKPPVSGEMYLEKKHERKD